MIIEKRSALLVIDIQQSAFVELDEDTAWRRLRNAKRVLDVFR